MHAFSYVPFWIGAIAYVNELAPADLKATSQGMLISIMNIANVFGALSARWLFDHLGVQGMYLSLAGVMVVSLATFIGWHLRLRRKMNK
jgi:predicted MFS family arabinose efflux permease